MKKIDELKEKASVDLKSAQEEFASLCEDYTDKELANLWDMKPQDVTYFRQQLGIQKSTDGSVKGIKSLPRNPFGEFSKKLKCGDAGMLFKLQGKYSVNEIIKILKQLDVFDEDNMHVSLTIREGGKDHERY